MVSKRTAELTSFIVMDVLEKANEMERQGLHIVHLEVGEPDFDAPACVKEAACQALANGHTHYTHSLGNYELREAIAGYYRQTYGVQVQSDQIIVTSGSSPAILLVFSALLDPGDEVIIPDPHYSCYPNFIKFVQGVPVTVPVYEEDGFQYRPEAIRRKLTARTKAIFINSPSNPTSNLLSAERMREKSGDLLVASELAKDLKEWIFSHIALEDRQMGAFLAQRHRQVTDFVKEQIRSKKLFLRRSQVNLFQQVNGITAGKGRIIRTPPVDFLENLRNYYFFQTTCPKRGMFVTKAPFCFVNTRDLPWVSVSIILSPSTSKVPALLKPKAVI